LLEEGGGGDRRFLRVVLGEAHLRIGIDERLVVDPADAFERARVKRILRPAVARTVALEFAVRFFLALHPLQRRQVRLGKNVAFLGHLGFERLQPMPHRDYIMANPTSPHAAAGNPVALLREFVGHAVLPPGGWLEHEPHHVRFEIRRSRLRRFGLRRLISRRASSPPVSYNSLNR
jgi:hypothetical protein